MDSSLRLSDSMIIKGVREPMMRRQIFLLTVVRKTTKRKGKRQAETEREHQKDLKRMKKQDMLCQEYTEKKMPKGKHILR
jgi:hypothetical protein